MSTGASRYLAIKESEWHGILLKYAGRLTPVVGEALNDVATAMTAMDQAEVSDAVLAPPAPETEPRYCPRCGAPDPTGYTEAELDG